MQNTKSKLLKNEYIEMYDQVKTVLYRSNINNFVYKDLCIDLVDYLYGFQQESKELPNKQEIIAKFNRHEVRRGALESTLMFLAWFALIYIFLFIILELFSSNHNELTITTHTLIKVIGLGLIFNTNMIIGNNFSIKSWVFMAIILVATCASFFIIENIYFVLPITFAVLILLIAILEICFAYKISKNNYFKYLNHK